MTLTEMQKTYNALTAEFFIEYGDDQDQADEFEAKLKKYINDGFDIDYVDRNNGTLFGYAVEYYKPNLLKVMSQYGANPNIPGGKYNYTPLARLLTTHDFCYYSPNPYVLPVYNALMEAGADPNAKDEEGRTALHQALRQQEDTFAVPNTFVILLSLIEAGADLYIKDNDGKTAYDLAAEAGVGVTHNPYGYKTIIEAYQNEKAKRPYMTPIAFTMTNMLRMLNCVVADTYVYGTQAGMENDTLPKWGDDIRDTVFEDNNIECYSEEEYNPVELYTRFFEKEMLLVFTGKLSSMPREQAFELAEEKGASVSNTVTKNTTFLVVGEKPGSKLKKAQTLGIPILSERDFLQMFSQKVNIEIDKQGNLFER